MIDEHGRFTDTIEGVAIKSTSGFVYTMGKPLRHSDLIRSLSQALGHAVPGDWEQGFYTQNNHFVNRWKAHRIAWNSGKCKRQPTESSELFSEDVW